MLTVCPSCARQFYIYKEHIAKASGQVRCGFCGEQFNALNNLLGNDSNADITRAPAQIPKEKHQKIILNAKKQQAKYKKSLTSLKPYDSNNKKTNQYILLEEELLFRKEIKNSSKGATFSWGVACLIALFGIFGQFFWFNRDKIILKYPKIRPYIKQLCQKLDCRVIRMRNLKKIKLLNRDVRLHPDYKNALLVNANIKNELHIRQPYPQIQFAIYDTKGGLLTYRNFMPKDYLNNSVDIEEGMPVNLPIHFILEIADISTDAVSFELRFL